MFRFIENDLLNWFRDKEPKPLLLRGARQVGKTYTVEKFARENFKSFLKINFEKEVQYHKLFEADLNMKEILQKIAIDKRIDFDIKDGLVFFDEIQECPRAITSLRYIYEDLPGLHCISAGSALEFTLTENRISIPVGRISYLYMYPLSFYEYLYNFNPKLLDWIKQIDLKNFDEFFHSTALKEFKNYMFLGGMPKVLDDFLLNDNFQKVLELQSSILDTYRDDFRKFGKKSHYTLMEQIYISSPKSIGHKFKYTQISKEIQSREIKQALDILLKAKVLKQVRRTSAAELPFEFEASAKHFKLIFLDIGLMHRMLGISSELLNTNDVYGLATGSLIEQVIGQELMQYSPSYQDATLYYWERSGKASSAEVDYLVSHNQKIIGLEVKSGARGKLKSLYSFMNNYKHNLGVCVSPEALSYERSILKLPCYAVQELPRILNEII